MLGTGQRWSVGGAACHTSPVADAGIGAEAAGGELELRRHRRNEQLC